MDDKEKENGHVFAIPDLWGPSSWLLDVEQNSGLLFTELKLDGMLTCPFRNDMNTNLFSDIDRELPDIAEQTIYNDPFFAIPDLSFGPSDNIPTPIQSPELPQVFEDAATQDDVDIWLVPEDTPLKQSSYQSWDGFENEESLEPYTPYITEAGPFIFDAAIAGDRDYLHVGNAGYTAVDSKVYASSIFALGIGRNSVLFAWNEDVQSFKPTLSNMRLSGYTAESLDGLLSIFMDCGNITRYLQNFVDNSYRQTKSSGQIALAEVVSTLLSTLQSILSESTLGHQSLLQLQKAFQSPHSVLTCFQRIVKNTSKTRSDESMLSTIFEEIQLQEHRTDSLRDILIEILSRVSHPWLEFVGAWLGLQREAGLPLTKEGNGKSFVAVADKEWIDDLGIEVKERDYILDYDRVPAFVAPEDARTIFEVGKNLRLLRDHHSDHPLVRADIVASAQPPSFEWKFSWQEIVAVETKALQYEQDLRVAVQAFSKDLPMPAVLNEEYTPQEQTNKLDFFGKLEEDIKAHLLASIDAFNLPLEKEDSKGLSSILSSYLKSNWTTEPADNGLFSPPISLVPVLAFNPIISAQARLVNNTCMRMFFKSHNLRQHLAVQRSFHLFGNGVFSSRLSHALFDPELESAERHRGVARTGGIMGLRLADRETWPPASSELRLALMGVLTDTYVSKDTSSSQEYLEKSLPGDLSFAVRDMSEDEIEKCKNADSIEALDFLRLSYKPPAPLEAVITPIILFKYDQIFKLLLRVIRMLYVISALFRDITDRSSQWENIDHMSQRFRIEAHHFISTVSEYFFDMGVETTWRLFEAKLDQVEVQINADDETIALGEGEGLDKLRDCHERVLDRIMFALFLRKRQQPIMHLLEEIFTLILRFSKISRQRALGVVTRLNTDDEVKEIYLKFKKKVGVFMTVCRGLSEKRGYGENRAADYKEVNQAGLLGGDDLTEGNTISYLLVRLEMSNYYSQIV